MKTIKIKAPATVANLVCGFDVLGMALEHPQDEMELTLLNKPQLIIQHKDKYGLPTTAEKNVAGVALLALMKAYEKPIGFKVVINKIIKPGSGLGSSAASAAGAVVAANKLLKNYFTKNELVQFAMFGEELASGSKHADNIAPCIYGGVCLIRSNHPLDIIPLKTPKLFVTVVHPQIEIKTSEARAILPKEISLKNAVKHWGNVAALVAGISQNNPEIIANSLRDDIIEPVRKKLIPGFDRVKKRSLTVGALGGGISGSGPSIFMFSTTKKIAEKVEKEMIEIYREFNIEAKTYVSKISKQGVSEV
ncbi:MAG: homoserine kinase [Chitinophagaceae bacterium]|nr:homoserine kinase [Chitinophagaceae bacterium]